MSECLRDSLAPGSLQAVAIRGRAQRDRAPEPKQLWLIEADQKLMDAIAWTTAHRR